ncbi:MAG: Gfo/Idh/MocA family oxidoreductase [Methylacidiphilales bacterium]|nr:Gfo/Idh/MocA family oxidoreductase [Candidatus Methylacidiphilales bacterium]
MTKTKNVRIGIAGLGTMGSGHARSILEGKIPRLQLTAATDVVAGQAATVPDVPFFPTPEAMINSGLIDAILIVTPHFSHTTIGIAALKAGLHVLVEKPISVHKADAKKLIAAHSRKRLVFAAMFNQRTDPYYATIREMIQNGTLGALRRINWTVTDWFRPNAYYASGGWRATWQGEGGGILLNQCPHNLDLMYWLFGQPERVRAFCQLGRYHDIEVEDDVTAYLEYPGGATGVFITSTGEAPGANRLEIAGENGKLVMENDRLVFTENEIPMSEFCRTSAERFAKPKATERIIPVEGHGRQHQAILENFTEAILDGKPLIAPAREGIYSVELANAMILSSFKKRAVKLPLNGNAYEKLLLQKIAESPRSKKSA